MPFNLKPNILFLHKLWGNTRLRNVVGSSLFPPIIDPLSRFFIKIQALFTTIAHNYSLYLSIFIYADLNKLQSIFQANGFSCVANYTLQSKHVYHHFNLSVIHIFRLRLTFFHMSACHMYVITDIWRWSKDTVWQPQMCHRTHSGLKSRMFSQLCREQLN